MQLKNVKFEVKNNYLFFDTASLLKRIEEKYPKYEIAFSNNRCDLTRTDSLGRKVKTNLNLSKDINAKASDIGLIKGEGHINEKQFVFANSSDKVIQEIALFLSQFDLEYKTCLEVCVKKTKNPEKFIKSCKKFWERKIKAKIDHFRFREEFVNTTKNGTIHISLNNCVVAKMLKEIISVSEKIIENDYTLSKDYLKGIIAGEGNINIKKNELPVSS